MKKMTTQPPVETTAFYLGSVNADWKQYNLYTADLLLGTPGNLSQSPYKRINRGTDFTSPNGLVSIVGRDYALLPNEEIERVMTDLAETFSLTRESIGYSKSGNALFLTYLSPKAVEIVKGDSVRFGVSIRNSIDGSMGLGIDSFTLRKICGNGAIGRADMVSTYRKHTQGLKDIIATLRQRIEGVLADAEALAARYQTLTKTTLTPEIAQTISTTYLPAKYLPWDFKEEKRGDKTITLPDLTTFEVNQDWAQTQKLGIPSDSMWAVYNHVTGSIWHSKTVRKDGTTVEPDPQSKNLYALAFDAALEKAIPQIAAPRRRAA